MTRSRAVHDKVHALYGGLLKSVIERRGTTGPVNCIADRILDQNEKNGLTDHNVMLLAGVTLKGGSDTTASTLTSWLQAMVLYPEVQKKAQAEIDEIVGEKRLPTWADYSSMPYIATLVKEAMRWRPTAPLGFPHALSEGNVTNADVTLELMRTVSQISGSTENSSPKGLSCSSMFGVYTTTKQNFQSPILLTPIIIKGGRCWRQITPTLQIMRTATTMVLVRLPSVLRHVI